jgi:hypothetical protein
MDANLSQTIAKVTVALAPAFACGFAVQQALQIIDPLVSRPDAMNKPDSGNLKRAVMGLISLMMGALIAGLGKVDVVEALSKAADGGSLTLPIWLGISVNALIISAGTEGFNSIMKFLSYQKESAKADAAVKKADAATKEMPDGKGALDLVNG